MDSKLACKLANFNLRKNLTDEAPNGFYTNPVGQRVMRWPAPEVGIMEGGHRKYSPVEDVWGYGIMLYELFTKGLFRAVPSAAASVTSFAVTVKCAEAWRLTSAVNGPQAASRTTQTHGSTTKCTSLPWRTFKRVPCSPRSARAQAHPWGAFCA